MMEDARVPFLFLLGAILASAGVALHEGLADGPSSFPRRAVLPAIAADGIPGFQPPADATATPTPPLPPPTAPTAGLSLQGGWLWTDTLGYAHITGLVVNNFPYPVEFVEITGKFYGSGGRLLATDWTFASLRAISAFGSSPYELLLFPAIPGIQSAEAEVTDYDTELYYPMPSGLTAVITNTVVDTIGYGHIYGTVTNNSSSTWEFVEVIIALATGGRIVAVDSGFARPHTLAPGQTGTFEVLVSPHAGISPVDFSGLTLYRYVDADAP